MKTNQKMLLKVALGIVSTLTLGTSLMAQDPDLARPESEVRLQAQSETPARTQNRVSMVSDWSRKNLIFSAPKSVQQSYRLQRDPRYMEQYYRRALAAQVQPGNTLRMAGSNPTLPGRGGDRIAEPEDGPLHRDWTANMGASATVGNDQFPAKFSFNVNPPVTMANCTSDYVAYNTNTASGTGATGFLTKAYDYGFFWNVPNLGSTIVINGKIFTAIANSKTAATGTNFQQGTSPSQAAYNFATAVNANTSGTFTYTAQLFFGNWVIVWDTTAGSAGNNSTVGPTAPPNNTIDCFPFFFGGCHDSENFTWFFPNFIGGRGASGTATANLVALNNLYSICGSAPSTYFAYGTSTMSGGATTSSVALSMDGTKLAFVESSSSGSALHILKWKAGSGTVTAPATPITATSSANWASCTSCEVVLAMGRNTSSNSAPFVDYYDDVIYVGDDNGVLYKFSGVFLGSWPSKTWTETVNSGIAATRTQAAIPAQLTGPVFDSVTGNVFVADSLGCVSYVSTSPVAVYSCKIRTSGTSTSAGNPIPDPPIVDSGSERVMVFVGDNGSGSAEVIQTDIALNNPATLQVGAAGSQMHSGDFDNNYYSGSTAQGYLYYCGKQLTQDLPTIRRLTFDAAGNFTGSDPDYLQVGSTLDSECSPLTEVYNNGMDMMFFGVTAGGSGANCTTMGGSQFTDTNPSAGCLMSINVTNGVFPTAIAASLGEPGGTSGIVIDNVVSANSASGSGVYFTPLTVGTANGACTGDQGCAVKATQNGLN